jgi:hypothetical protein
VINIIGDGIIPEAQAFYDVRDALHFDQDVTLAAMCAIPLGIPVDGAIYNMEPLYDGCRSLSGGYIETLRKCAVLDYSAKNIEYLKAHGIEAFHMPYGYHDSLYRPVKAEKDIDLLFVGSMNPRRAALFRDVRKDIDFLWAIGVYGKELDKLIARAKVVANVHYCEDHQLEVVRLNYLMANHCTVVSEPGNEHWVNEKYDDGLYFAEYGDFLDACYAAIHSPLDGHDCIKSIPHSCKEAQEWLNLNA